MGLQPTRPRGYLAAFLAGATLLAGAAAWAIVYQRRGAAAEWEVRLRGYSQERARLVERWLAERAGDARMFAAFPLVGELVAAGARSESPVARRLRPVADAVARNHDYVGVYVTDDRGRVAALSVTGLPLPSAGDSVAAVARVRDSERVSLIAGTYGEPLVVVTVPAPPAGAVTLVASPAERLFRPLVADPTFARAIEVLLVQPLGDAIEILTPPRPLPAAPLAAPPTRLRAATLEPGRRAVLVGGADFVRYANHRGRDVMAAGQPVSRTPWRVVVTVDESVAFGPWARLARSEVLITAAMIVLLGAAVIALRHRRRMLDFEGERRLRDTEQQLRLLARRLMSVRDEEQTRIAREIHDHLGQSLTMLKLDLERLAGAPRRRRAGPAPHATELIAQVDALIAATRSISAGMRPPILEDLGLAAALEWAVARFTERTRVRAGVEGDPGDLPADVARALYGIAQEALTNVARHAVARSVRVRVGAENGTAVLEVRDDGVGFDPAASADQSLGLLGMRERAQALGGVLEVRSQPGGGTSVVARIPLAGVA